MGLDTVSVLSYGFIIPQSKVLELLQLLQKGTEYETKDPAEDFIYEDADILQELLTERLKEGGIDVESFSMQVMQIGDGDEFEGFAILYNGMYGMQQDRSYGAIVRPYAGESTSFSTSLCN
jgi:hypothetical protein